MHNESNLPAIAERKTLGRRSVVRGAAWAAPVVGLAAAAPAYAASRTFDWPPFNYTGWEWNNSIVSGYYHDMMIRGAEACAGDQAIPANDLKITITLPNSLSRGAGDCGDVYTNQMHYMTGIPGWGGSANWSFSETSTGSGTSRNLIWTFTYTQPIAAHACVRLSFNADVDVDHWACALNYGGIGSTPDLSYTVTATNYTPMSWPIDHNNNIV